MPSQASTQPAVDDVVPNAMATQEDPNCNVDADLAALDAEGDGGAIQTDDKPGAADNKDATAEPHQVGDDDVSVFIAACQEDVAAQGDGEHETTGNGAEAIGEAASIEAKQGANAGTKGTTNIVVKGGALSAQQVDATVKPLGKKRKLNVVKPVSNPAHNTLTAPSNAAAVDALPSGTEESAQDDSGAPGTAPSDAVMPAATAAPAPPVKRGTKKLAARLVVTTATAEDVSAPSKEGEKAGDTGVLPSAVAPVVPKAKKKLAFVAAAAGSGPADNAKCDTKKTSKTADSVGGAKTKKAKTAAGKKGVQKAPRAKSAYLFFQADKRPALKEAEPGLDMGATSKKLAEMWKAATDEEKALYQAKAEEDQKRVVALKADGGKAAAGAPKTPRAPTAYVLFSSANRDRIKAANPGASFGDMGKLLAQAWKEASADERAPFEAAHAEAKAKLPQAEKKVTASAAISRQRKTGVKAAKLSTKRKAADEDDNDDTKGDSVDEAAEDDDDTVIKADEADEFESERQSVNWQKHPAEYILAHNLKGQYLVKRKGCPLLDYGLVDMAVAKRQRLQAVLDEADTASGEKCPLALSLVEDYEAFEKGFKRAMFDRMDTGELDMDDLEAGSPLEMCSYLVQLQQPGYPLHKAAKKRGDNDTLIQVPGMKLALVVQRLMDSKTRELAAKDDELQRVKAELQALQVAKGTPGKVSAAAVVATPEE